MRSSASRLVLAVWMFQLQTLESFVARPPIGFCRPPPVGSRSSSFLPRFVVTKPEADATANANANTAKTTSTSTEEEELSDVDARVLQSLLKDSKLDLDTEDDVRKLLERGTVKSVPKQPQASEPETESDYASTAFKTLADTKLWKKVSAQASDLFESVGIWVSNKVEQDVQVLAALGLFAWDRAVRDVSRALPEAGTQAQETAQKTIFLLTNRSAFVQQQPLLLKEASSQKEKSAQDEMRRPSDEIKTVSREILGILSGRQRSSSGRSLRTAAPTGFGNSAERQRRAYQQKRRVDRQEKDMTRVAGNVVDTAWELRRELTAETNQPGYKTEPIRNAIEAGVAGTGNLLRAVQEEARLAASRRKEERRLNAAAATEETSAAAVLPPPSSTTSSTTTAESVVAETTPEEPEKTIDSPIFAQTVGGNTNTKKKAPTLSFATEEELFAALKEERRRIADQLKECIQEPGDSWLQNAAENTISDDSLRDVITRMVVLRNEMVRKQQQQEGSSTDVLFGSILDVRMKVQSILNVAEESLPPAVAYELRKELLGLALSLSDQTGTGLLSKLEGVVDYRELILQNNGDDRVTATTRQQQSSSAVAVDSSTTAASPELEVLDVVTEPVIVTAETVAEDGSFSSSATTTTAENTVTEVVMEHEKKKGSRYRNVVAEVVSDTDFDEAVGKAEAAKQVKEVAEQDDEANKEQSLPLKLTLRALDIVFFVLEKFVIAGIPQALIISMTAMERLNQVNEKGKGKIGWEQFQKLDNAKGRY